MILDKPDMPTWTRIALRFTVLPLRKRAAAVFGLIQFWLMLRHDLARTLCCPNYYHQHCPRPDYHHLPPTASTTPLTPMVVHYFNT